MEKVVIDITRDLLQELFGDEDVEELIRIIQPK